MDEESDVQIIDVSEKVMNLKMVFELQQTSLLKFTTVGMLVQKYSGSTPMHLITFLNTV